MRLAYFTNTYPRATDTFIRREVIGLRARGLEVLTYSVRKTGADHDVDDEVIQEKRNTTFLLPFNYVELLKDKWHVFKNDPKNYFKTFLLAVKTSRPGIKGHFLQMAYFVEAISLARKLERDGIQHVHNHLGDNSGTVTMLAAKLAGIPYSISIHGPHIFFDGLHWALDKKTEYSKFISCIGHFCTSQMMLYADKEYWSKFKIIRCGVNLQQFNFSLPQGKAKELVYVGRLSAEKGVPILFESIAQLHQQGYELTLTLLGDGPDRAFLENLAREMNIQHCVNFKGFVDQTTIATTLKASDIFVLPSFAEGIPVALMEAMAIGLPVITTYVGGITELVIDQQTGLVVYPSDVNGLANAIAKYLDNPALCQEIAQRARAMVEQEFNIEDQVDKLADLFTDGEFSRSTSVTPPALSGDVSDENV